MQSGWIWIIIKIGVELNNTINVVGKYNKLIFDLVFDQIKLSTGILVNVTHGTEYKKQCINILYADYNADNERSKKYDIFIPVLHNETLYTIKADNVIYSKDLISILFNNISYNSETCNNSLFLFIRIVYLQMHMKEF